MINTQGPHNKSGVRSPAPDRDQERQALVRLDRYATLLDSRFRIPFTDIRVGFDPIIGLLPGIGDAVGLALSLYLIGEGLKLGVGRQVLGKMVRNVAIEFVVGIVPVLGDAFDVFWKANDRNVKLLRATLEQRLEPPEPRRLRLPGSLVVLLCLLLIVLAGVLVVAA